MKEYLDKAEVLGELEEMNCISFYEMNEFSKETYYEIKRMLQSLQAHKFEEDSEIKEK